MIRRKATASLKSPIASMEKVGDLPWQFRERLEPRVMPSGSLSAKELARGTLRSFTAKVGSSVTTSPVSPRVTRTRVMRRCLSWSRLAIDR